MGYKIWYFRLKKIGIIFLYPKLLWIFLKYFVLAGVEHRTIFDKNLKTIIDIGANRGQFSLAAKTWLARSSIFAFEPIPEAADKFRKVFQNYSDVRLFETAIGPCSAVGRLNITSKNDSSSLLPIGQDQVKYFSNSQQSGYLDVQITTLSNCISSDEIIQPAMLKLDVQGYEAEALLGCEDLLHHFNFIYCECSFVELYVGQKLIGDIINWLSARNFNVVDFLNPTYARDGKLLQADLLFKAQTI